MNAVILINTTKFLATNFLTAKFLDLLIRRNFLRRNFLRRNFHLPFLRPHKNKVHWRMIKMRVKNIVQAMFSEISIDYKHFPFLQNIELHKLLFELSLLGLELNYSFPSWRKKRSKKYPNWKKAAKPPITYKSTYLPMVSCYLLCSQLFKKIHFKCILQSSM